MEGTGWSSTSASDLRADDVERSCSWPGAPTAAGGGPLAAAGAAAAASVEDANGCAASLQTLQRGVVLFGLRKVRGSMPLLAIVSALAVCAVCVYVCGDCSSPAGAPFELDPNCTRALATAPLQPLPKPLAMHTYFCPVQVYSGGSRLLRTAKEHVAVAGTWLAIPPGRCLCLLGPNGAGKTTTINCLTGMDSTSGGDALVAGHSVSSPGGVDDRARAALGVCFQFDVLWPKLTGREHLQLVAAIRGLEHAQASAQVEELLQQVGCARSRCCTIAGAARRSRACWAARTGGPHQGGGCASWQLQRRHAPPPQPGHGAAGLAPRPCAGRADYWHGPGQQACRVGAVGEVGRPPRSWCRPACSTALCTVCVMIE
jgi:hypothetical protein